MTTSQMTTKELRKEISKLMSNVSRRIERIERRGELASQYASEKYRVFEKALPPKWYIQDRKELVRMYRDLRDINALKSSTVKGAERIRNVLDPLLGKMKPLSMRKIKTIQSIYNKLVEQNILLDYYRYEIIDTATDMVLMGESEEDIIASIQEAFKKAYERGKDERKTKAIFVKNLSELTL